MVRLAAQSSHEKSRGNLKWKLKCVGNGCWGISQLIYSMENLSILDNS